MSENQQLSPEQLEKKRKELTEFYENQIPILKLRKEYEELQTDIQEAQTRRNYAIAQLAQLQYKDDKTDSEDGTSEPSK
jgi:seryl-tRNA synthetase